LQAPNFGGFGGSEPSLGGHSGLGAGQQSIVQQLAALPIEVGATVQVASFGAHRPQAGVLPFTLWQTPTSEADPTPGVCLTILNFRSMSLAGRLWEG